MLSEDILNSYVGHSIAEICPYGYHSSADNHCAHFVAHALQMGFGLTCGNMQGGGGGANLRVQEIFRQCDSRREILVCPSRGQGLIFVSGERSFSGTPARIANVPRKHIGILSNGKVWHYSNSRRRVITQTPAEFLYHYRRQKNSLWYGSFPTGCRAASFGTST